MLPIIRTSGHALALLLFCATAGRAELITYTFEPTIERMLPERSSVVTNLVLGQNWSPIGERMLIPLTGPAEPLPLGEPNTGGSGSGGSSGGGPIFVFEQNEYEFIVDFNDSHLAINYGPLIHHSINKSFTFALVFGKYQKFPLPPRVDGSDYLCCSPDTRNDDRPFPAEHLDFEGVNLSANTHPVSAGQHYFDGGNYMYAKQVRAQIRRVFADDLFTEPTMNTRIDRMTFKLSLEDLPAKHAGFDMSSAYLLVYANAGYMVNPESSIDPIAVTQPLTSVVPEPASRALLLLSGVALTARRRKTR